MNKILLKLCSPIVWATTLTVAVTQLKLLQDGEITLINILIGICTVLIAFLGALNNPDTRNKF